LTVDKTSNPNSGPVRIPVAAMFLADWLTRWISCLVSTWRLKLVLRWLGCAYGRRLLVDGNVIVRVRHPGSITIGNEITICSRFRSNLVGMTGPTVFHCIRDGRICVGDGSGCSSTVFSSRSSIRVGKNVRIGGNARIYDHDFHAVDPLSRRQAATDSAGCKTAPVVIGDDVFIGANAMILKGVTIGDRSIIGAGSVVSIKGIPPDSLVAGNPARVIRRLKKIAEDPARCP
jgi:acetyltransferase-like isoleucine patch superfamily enzyme